VTRIQQGTLSSPQVYTETVFGPDVENQGAVLLDCVWEGSSFVSGVFMGGMFRSGEFAGGIFLGGVFLAGKWSGGIWEGGFDIHGIYHPRGDDPSCW
jgi:hypothetical protein